MHPVGMVIHHLHGVIYEGHTLGVGQAIWHSFQLHLWPMLLLYGLSGGLIGLLVGVIFRRLSENRQRLEAFHRDFELQVATLRHHYKNLALGIQGFSGRLKRKLAGVREELCRNAAGVPTLQDLSPQLDELLVNLEVLDDAARRLNQTLSQELMFLRIVTSEQLRPEPQDFIPLLVRCVRELQALRFRDREIRVEINGRALADCQDSLVFAFEPATMEVILHNILGNAMKVADCLRISTTVADGWIRLAVADNGPGLQAEELRQYLSAPGPRQEAESTRLGLRVTVHLMQKLGARLAVASQPGAGATFFLDFPQQQP